MKISRIPVLFSKHSYMQHHLAKALCPYKRFIKWAVYVLLGLIGSLIFCIYSERGTHAIFALVNRTTPVSISYESLNGKLASNLDVSMLDIRYQDNQFKAKRLKLHWSMLYLFSGQLDVQALEGEQITISLKQDSTHQATQQFETIEAFQQWINQTLPLAVTIHALDLKDMVIQTADSTQQVCRLCLTELATHNVLALNALSYQGSYGRFNLKQDKYIDANWDLNVPNMPSFTPLSKGMQTKGALSFHVADQSNAINDMNIQLAIPQVITAQTTVNNINLSLSGTPLDHDLTITGQADTPFEINLHGTFNNNQWDTNITKAIFKPNKSKQAITLSGPLSIQYNDKLVINSEVNWLQHRIQSNWTVDLNKPFPLSGHITTQIKEIDSLKPFFPILNQAQGALQADLYVSGSALKPDFYGDIAINTLAVPIKQYNTTAIIKELTLSKSADSKIAMIQGTGYIQQQPVALTGQLDLTSEQPDLELHLKGEQLLVSDTPEYKVLASPNIVFQLNNNQPTLSGQILIDEANISPVTRKHKASLSSDVVIIDDEKKQTALNERTLPLKTELDILLGDKIHFQGHNLNAQVTGQLKISQKPNQAAKLSGDIILVNGQYKFQGKTFDLTHGKLIYSGNTFDNPLIDIEAKQVMTPLHHKSGFSAQSPLELGVRIKGKLNDPQISFFSKPHLPEADIMSYIVLGRPQSQATQAQEEILFTAISQLATLFGKKQQDVSFNLADKLNLDHIGFSKIKTQQGSSIDDTVLTLGKQLSSQLYMNYSHGFYAASSQLGLQYRLNKNVSIEAQTGTNGRSADVIFSIDR